MCVCGQSRRRSSRALVRDQALPTAMAVCDFLSGALPVFVLLFTTSGIAIRITKCVALRELATNKLHCRWSIFP